MNVNNKKGFVLIETIIVMSILLIGMILLYSNYNKMILNSGKINYYDNVEDIYTAYYISKYLEDLINLNNYDNHLDISTIDNNQLLENLNVVKIYYFSKKEFKNIFDKKNNKTCEEDKNQLICFDGSTINYLKSIENKAEVDKCDDDNKFCITIVKLNRDSHYYFAKYEEYNI